MNAQDGVFVVIASPGSGKTECVIQRFMKMLMRGIPSSDILNLSFTSAAASEMVKRAGLLDSESVFRTFHSFAIEILKKERQHLPFELCDSIIPVAAEDYQLLFDLVKIYPTCNWRTLKERIERWKCDDVLPDQAVDENRHRGAEYFYALAYRDYEIKCRERGWLDFDSLMRTVVCLLDENEEVRNRWKKKYITVDECQDTDAVQAEFIQLLFDGNLLIVGDLNQGVYEWRSAAPDYLAKFVKTLPNAQTLYLGQNFRSTQKIVSFLKEILPENNGLASHMFTENEEGIDPVIEGYDNEIEEAECILKKVTDPINTAVIARTNRQLYVFQRLCVLKNIKYKILSKKDFFETNEVTKLLKLAKEVHDGRPANVVLEDLIKRHNLFELYKHSGNIWESNPIENLNAVVKMSANKGTVPEFLAYLRRLTGARRSHKGLALSTGHSAKGRQWDHVFVVGVNEGILPHKDGELGEEKRLFFVGCSRASKKLTISYYDNPSQFIPEDYLNENVQYLQKD